MENKRGMFEETIFSIVLLLAVIFLAFFFFSTRFRFIVIGVGLIIIGLVTLLGKSIKKEKTKITIFFILIGIGLIMILSSSVLQSVSGSGSYIERPIFYYDKCEQCGGLKGSAINTFSDNWVIKPSVTDEYSVIITEIGGLLKRRVTYSICNSRSESASNCRIYKKITTYGEIEKSELDIERVKPNEYVHLKYEVIDPFSFGLSWDLKNAKYQVFYQPYCLRRYNVLGGASIQVNPNSCTYSSRQTDTLVSTDSNTVKNAFQDVSRSTDENTLQPNEVRWYVAGYLTSAEPSFKLTYDKQDAWCRDLGSGGEIYKINKVTTPGGTYKIASADWSDFLGNVNCCPGETKGNQVCNSKFQYETIAGSECSIFKSCGSPNWVPFTSKQLVKYSCDNGYCKQQTKNVECASDYDCQDSNEVCDLKDFTCVNANVNLDGQKIDTIPDNQADCQKAGGTWITSQTSRKVGFLCFYGIGLCNEEVITEEYCDFGAKNNYLLWGIIIAIFIVMVVAIYFLNRK